MIAKQMREVTRAVASTRGGGAVSIAVSSGAVAAS
jgi:glutamate 5-kinase